jgi:3D (Asp-Asp-Asp) domain-containing protein
MLERLAEKVFKFFGRCRKFKDTKVYNYKLHILTILVTFIVIGSLTIIPVGGESTPKEYISTQAALDWKICTTAAEPETTTEVEVEIPATTVATTTTTAPTTVKTTTAPTTKKASTTTTTQSTKVEATSKIVTTAQSKLIGRFKITVYCACSKCCGKYAYNRPVDANGNVIVTGASGRRLIPYYSIATDPRVIPSGTEVVINGKVYRADDTGGAVKGNVIDIYAGLDHDEAMRFAYAMESQYANVYWK